MGYAYLLASPVWSIPSGESHPLQARYARQTRLGRQTPTYKAKTSRLCFKTTVPPKNPEAEAVIRALEHQLDGLTTCASPFEAELKLPLLPPFHLQGTAYYKHPHQVRVEFDKLPPLIERFRNTFAGLTPRYSKSDEYYKAYEGSCRENQELCDQVRLTPADSDSNLQSATLWVSRLHKVVVKTLLRYDDGSVLESQAHYQRVGRYWLPTLQDVRFELPALRASAQVHYTCHRLNVPLPSGLFTETGGG